MYINIWSGITSLTLKNKDTEIIVLQLSFENKNLQHK